MCLSFAYHYQKVEPVPITWKLNVDGLHDLTDPKQRPCAWCLEVEDEEHFITRCQINAHERQLLYTKIGSKHPEFQNISNHEQFIFLMSCKDRQI